MKRILFSLLIGLILILAACSSIETAADNLLENLQFKVVKSETTGNCYEIAITWSGYLGLMGMEKVDCKFLE